MTDLRKRAEEIADLHTPIIDTRYNERLALKMNVVDAMLAFAAERVAAEKARLQDCVIDYLGDHLPPDYWKDAVIENVASLLQVRAEATEKEPPA